MKKIFVLILSFMPGLCCYSQDINVTFTPTGEATIIDSITALNQRINQSVTLPGNETLVLRRGTGIEDINFLTDQIVVYPNPFSGSSKLSVTVNEPQRVVLSIKNMTGHVVAKADQYLQGGNNEFEISLSDNGFYAIIVENNQGFISRKLVNLFSSSSENKIYYTGLNTYVKDQSGAGSFKSEQTEYSLDFTEGDNMHYTCYSSVMTTIFTDSPKTSKEYDVDFAQCTDPDGKNYDVVIIGDQMWMEDNLAYLPAVSSSSEGSDSIPFYYVNGYEGNVVSEAKATENYEKYGALYNWTAAMAWDSGSTSNIEGEQGVCPDGWHIPSNSDWTRLTDFLILNGYGFGGDRFAIAKAMASSTEWTNYTMRSGTIGNNQRINNTCGFNALPGGVRYYATQEGWIFCCINHVVIFWSSSNYLSQGMWFIELGYRLKEPVLQHSSFFYTVTRAGGYSVRCLKDTE